MQNQSEKQQNLLIALQNAFGEKLREITVGDMVTIVISREDLIGVCKKLYQEQPFQFHQLSDLCGVD